MLLNSINRKQSYRILKDSSFLVIKFIIKCFHILLSDNKKTRNSCYLVIHYSCCTLSQNLGEKIFAHESLCWRHLNIGCLFSCFLPQFVQCFSLKQKLNEGLARWASQWAPSSLPPIPSAEITGRQSHIKLLFLCACVWCAWLCMPVHIWTQVYIWYATSRCTWRSKVDVGNILPHWILLYSLRWGLSSYPRTQLYLLSLVSLTI